MKVLTKSSAEIDAALKKILARQRTGSSARMYDMLGYFFGFLNEHFEPEKDGSSGKRFRPGLCLYLAECYGAREFAMQAALAIELFHNFTLIHDDVEDRDLYRRSKPTLWKLFGVNHAINAGDALSLIACEAAAHAPPAVTKELLAAFGEVIEGQYMDFELSTGSTSFGVAEYMLSTEKKTGALVGIAAQAAGMCASQNEAECAHLREYGRELGIAFQLADDYRSIWSSYEATGKDAHSDIREHKRTLPFFFAYEETKQKARLAELYNLERQLSETEIHEAKEILDSTAARTRTLEVIRTHAQSARTAARALSLPDDVRETLANIVDTLVPEATGK